MIWCDDYVFEKKTVLTVDPQELLVGMDIAGIQAMVNIASAKNVKYIPV